MTKSFLQGVVEHPGDKVATGIAQVKTVCGIQVVSAAAKGSVQIHKLDVFATSQITHGIGDGRHAVIEPCMASRLRRGSRQNRYGIVLAASSDY